MKQMLTRQRCSDHRASRMSSDHPSPWRILSAEEAIESPFELSAVGAAKRAAPREFDQVCREGGRGCRAQEWRVCDRVNEGTGNENERRPIGEWRRLRNKEPDAILAFHGDSGIGSNR